MRSSRPAMTVQEDNLHLKHAVVILKRRLIEHKTKFRQAQAELASTSIQIETYTAQVLCPASEFRFIQSVDIDEVGFTHARLVQAINIVCNHFYRTKDALFQPLYDQSAEIEKLRIAINVLQDELNGVVDNVT